MTKERPLNKESGIETKIDSPSSLKDSNLSLERLLKEMNQSERVEEILNLHNLSAKNLEDDNLSIGNINNFDENEVKFQPRSNRSIHLKKRRFFKKWVYLSVFIFALFLILVTIGAYIDFYNSSINNDADYLELQLNKPLGTSYSSTTPPVKQ